MTSPYGELDEHKLTKLEKLEQNKKLSNNFQAYMNTAKLFFGNAYLSIPNTFIHTGFIGGLILFVFIGIINCYTMILNLVVADRYPRIPSYSELSKKVFGKKGKMVVDISIWIM